MTEEAPKQVISKRWGRYVVQDDGQLNPRAYTFCMLSELHTALNRRDVFVSTSWRYADSRAGLLSGQQWEVSRPIICRTLGFSSSPKPVLAALTKELDDLWGATEPKVQIRNRTELPGDL
jgi:hypothetical protein